LTAITGRNEPSNVVRFPVKAGSKAKVNLKAMGDFKDAIECFKKIIEIRFIEKYYQVPLSNSRVSNVGDKTSKIF
jgi:hypothetical protein